jgi:cytochrome c oxidase subunit III
MVSELNLKDADGRPGGARKMHPHKFTLWVAIGSIIMMFAGLTSAFIVKSNQVNWKPVTLPTVFWVSTAVILVSSVTMQMALRSIKQREMSRYRTFIAVTFVLGIAFVVLQWIGFDELWKQNITFKGAGAGQFLYVIFGLHAIHVIGGVIALLVMFFKAFLNSKRTYSTVPVEVAALYWHFVDFLWLYLLIFFLVIGKQ